MTNKAYVENANRDINYNETLVAKHLVEWHRKWSLAIACFIMFLIGAPLGAIIRKGGFGMPVVTSVFLYIIPCSINDWRKNGERRRNNCH